MSSLGIGSSRQIMCLIAGLICVWGGFNLVQEARAAGPNGQVTRVAKSGGTYTTSSSSTFNEGLLLGAGGLVAVVYGASGFRR